MIWGPDNFTLQTTSVWSFPERGKWATHDASYRGNWSPYVPRNIILRYSQERDVVLDQFAGGGTTLIEAKLLNRYGIGVDINPVALEQCKAKCDFTFEKSGKVFVKQGTACDLTFIPNEKIDLICTHPPYANIIQYSTGIEGDLSLLTLPHFLEAMKKVASESYRILKKEHFCAVMMGDIRRNGFVFPLGFSVMELFQQANFHLKEIILKEQHNCSSTPFWSHRSIAQNFLLLAHEYIFVFKK